MKKIHLGVMVIGCIVFIGVGRPSAAEPQVIYSGKKSFYDRQIYHAVLPYVEKFSKGLLAENKEPWFKLCDSEGGIVFRYLGQYETKLSCAEFAGLFAEKRSRWWGRSDGTGKPLVGTFAKIWLEKWTRVVTHHEKRGVNHFVMSGNTPNQGLESLSFVDLTWAGHQEYGGMDWMSLRLFFHFNMSYYRFLTTDIIRSAGCAVYPVAFSWDETCQASVC